MKHCLHFIVFLAVLVSGCDYLDVVPKNDITTIETVFEQREGAENFLLTCHVMFNNPLTLFAANPAFTGTDEVVAGDYMRKQYVKPDASSWYGLLIGDGLQMTSSPYGELWRGNSYYAGIRYCNIFLEQIGSVYNMEQREKDLWSAEIKALKAHFYFELLRRYGPIILVPTNFNVYDDIDWLKQPRAPFDTCVKEIVALLDDAMKTLPSRVTKDKTRWGFHSLESAAALKARVLLYAASPLFNGNTMYADFKNKDGVQLINQTEDREKWRLAAEAADEAISICRAGGLSLIDNITSKSTDLLNHMANIEKSVQAQNFESNEAILMLRPLSKEPKSFWYHWIYPYFPSGKSGDRDLYSGAQGCLGASLKMVEMYYTENGVPINADKYYDFTGRYQMSMEARDEYKGVVPSNTNVLGLHLKREPRFYAHIAADRCYWQRGPLPSDNLLVQAYQNEKFGTQEEAVTSSVPQNLSGYWIKKHLYSDKTGAAYDMAASSEEAVVVIRLAELYLISAEAWNEYLEAPDSRVYNPLDEVRVRAGIPKVVDAWTKYTNTPEKVKTRAGMREIIHREWDIEFAFEGFRFYNLRRWLTAAEELNSKLYGWDITGRDAQHFYNGGEPVVVWSKRSFVSPRDYLFPIRTEEVMISDCVQNPGW